VKRRRLPAIVLLAALFLMAIASGLMGPDAQYRQIREAPGARPSRQFPLGTDDLGRDRLARLLFATRVSLLLAPAAALLATLLAAVAGGTAGYFGGWWDNCIIQIVDLLLSLPWFFILLAARAMLPLNTAPLTSLLVTYGLLSVLGWAGPARVIRAGTRRLRDSEFALQASAEGCDALRILWRHVIPNLKPVLLAQVWTTIPVFILSEANLGMLGLSAGEPFPTWGNLLRELQNPLSIKAEAFVPLFVIAVAVACFKLATPHEELLK